MAEIISMFAAKGAPKFICIPLQIVRSTGDCYLGSYAELTFKGTGVNRTVTVDLKNVMSNRVQDWIDKLNQRIRDCPHADHTQANQRLAVLMELQEKFSVLHEAKEEDRPKLLIEINEKYKADTHHARRSHFPNNLQPLVQQRINQKLGLTDDEIPPDDCTP